jgi:4-amino-4-deoxy-L-arabinose transferase-like glycosyltransferase
VMRRFLRYLRIAFSATCLIACVMLCVLWVRSYQQAEFRRLGGHKVILINGKIQIDRTFDYWSVPTGHWHTEEGDDIATLWKSEVAQVPVETGVTLPFWLPTTLLSALSVTPWIFRRFRATYVFTLRRTRSVERRIRCRRVLSWKVLVWRRRRSGGSFSAVTCETIV